jgi:hypothetical protein
LFALLAGNPTVRPVLDILQGHPFFMSTPILYALCGVIVGALVGLTGVGGGSLMTP